MKKAKTTLKTQSIFKTIMLPLVLLLVVEMLLLVGGLTVGRVMPQLDHNAEDILSKQVRNRLNYLQSSMVNNWGELSALTNEINRTTQEMLDEGTLSLETLDSNSETSAPLLLRIYEEMISTLYGKKLSGIFVIFNTHDLSQDQSQGLCRDKTGLSIRDNDPSAPPSAYRADLLLERAPIGVVRHLNISTDAAWLPLFPFGTNGGTGYDDPLYRPFQAAYTAQSIRSAADFGYWSTKPYTFQGSNKRAIAYSVPLILEDGTVYGVLGIELLEDYLREQLPVAELFDSKQGSYMLAVSKEAGNGPRRFAPVLINGATLQPYDLSQGVTLTPVRDDAYTFVLDGYTYYAGLKEIPLYSSNTSFSNEKWALLGVARTSELYAFSHQVMYLLIFTMLLTLAVGICGSFFISRKLSRPIRKLSAEVDNAQRDKDGIPRLSTTGVTEIDSFSVAITDLSQAVVDASTRFLRIMEMASVEIGGFEVNVDEGKVFVTDNFFPLLGQDDVVPSQLTPALFWKLRTKIDTTLLYSQNSDGSLLYRVPRPQGGVRYLRIEVTDSVGHSVGLAEDVTVSTLERLRIEHDRDYDLLTGLLNRRAFYREMELLFRHPEKLGCTAVLMLDLDNLKSINDRFGHDWGDQYIRRAGQCFFRGIPPETLCSRVSGDEFFIVFAGYESREAVRSAIAQLGETIGDSEFSLPSGEQTRVCASGGVAWYPEDSENFNELIKFADFAMYQMKQTRKGQMGDFDLGVYNRESFLVQNRQELIELLDGNLVDYHFQPIVDAKTGQCFAYEALMRVNMPTLRAPDAVLRLAKESGRLQEVERMTWFRALPCYEALLQQGLVSEDARLFINSIASQCLTEEEQAQLLLHHGSLLRQVVIEITEDEDMNPAYTATKRQAFGQINQFALDDYGSGYNSEKNLLELSPQFVKVDISIVRDIDKDTNKQKIMTNIVDYAHERGMRIIAEGLETTAEMEKSLELGADLLQGFFLARPGAVPPEISSAALELIQAHWDNWD